MPDNVAKTGNSMIPANPSIAVKQIQDGAQQITPPSAGAPPTVGVVPAVVPQVTPPAQPVEAYDFWGGVEQRTDPTPEPSVAPPAPAPEPGQFVAPSPEPAQQPAALPQQQPGVTPDLSFEQQAAIVEAGAAGAPTPTQPPVQAPRPDVSAIEAQTIAHLAKTEYMLSEEQATRLISKPEEAFPEYAARLHVRLAGQIGQAMQQILPGIIEQVVDGKLKAQALENDFFRSYPQLSDPRFRPVVTQSLRMARQASPQADRNQIMSDGAALAAMKLRLTLTNGAQQPVAVPQVPVQAQPLPVQPFQPALGGGAPLQPTTQEQANEFEVLAADPNW